MTFDCYAALPCRGRSRRTRRNGSTSFTEATCISDACEQRADLLKELQSTCDDCKRHGLPYRTAQKSLHIMLNNIKFDVYRDEPSSDEAMSVLLIVATELDKIRMITRSLRVSLRWKAHAGWT